MSDATQQLELNLVPTVAKVYSLSHSAGKIPMLPRVHLYGLNRFDTDTLKVTVFGECSEGTFAEPVDFVFERFCPHGYSFTDDAEAILEFSYEDIPVNLEFFTHLEESCDGQLTIRAEFCGKVAVCEEKIHLHPYSVWSGIYETPELIAAFVTPNHREIERILKGISPLRKKRTADEIKTAASALYRTLQTLNLIYTRPEARFAEKGQKMKLADTLFARNSRSMYPLDLAVLFCAAAEYLNLSPVICFVKGESGASQVFCGVWLIDCPVTTAVFESFPHLQQALERGDLLLIDPASFTAGHSTDFLQSCKGAYLQITKGGHVLLYAADIGNCRKSGISPMPIFGTLPEFDFSDYDGDFSANIGDAVTRKLALAERDLLESRDNIPLGDFLSAGNLHIPLLLPDLYAIEQGAFFTERELVSCPSEINLAELIYSAENFCSMVLQKVDTAAISQAEKTFAAESLTSAKAILSKRNTISSALSTEQMEQVRKELFFTEGVFYLAAGFLRTRTGGAESYAPLVLYPVKLQRREGRFYLEREKENPTVNRMLLGKLLKLAGIPSNEYIEETLPATLKEIFTLFENIAAILSKDNKVKRDVLREVYLAELDLTDYHLWVDLVQRREKMKKSPAVRALAAKSDEFVSIGKRGEFGDFFQPLFADGAQKAALNADGSFILEGPRGSGKLQVLANLAAKEVFNGSNVIAVSAGDLPLKRFEERLTSVNLTDLCLFLYDGKATRGVVFDTIKTALREVNKRCAYPADESEYTLKKVKDEIYAYEYALHKKYSFGFSLYEAIGAYEQARLIIGREAILPLYDGASPDTLDAAQFEGLFTLLNNLISSARGANAACGRLKALPLAQHPLYGTTPPDNSADNEKIKEAIAEAKRKAALVERTMKDLLSPLNLTSNNLCTLPKASAANSLVQLALAAKGYDIPEELYDSDISVFTERIGALKAILTRIEKIKRTLDFFTPDIYALDTDFSDEGDAYENKNFLQRFIVRKNVAEQLSAYIIPEKRASFSQKSTGEILRLLAEHKTLTKTLNETGGEITADAERFSNIVKISDFAERANLLYSNICDFDARDRQEKLIGMLRFASLLSANTDLAEKAVLSGVYFGELEAELKKLNAQIGLDVSEHHCPEGIYSEVGLTLRLAGIEDSISAFDKWNRWLFARKKAVDMGLYSFCERIEQSGAAKNIEHLFSAAIFAPAINHILSADPTCAKENGGPISEKEYYKLLRGESGKSLRKLRFAYAKELDEYLQTDEGKQEKNALEVALGDDTREIADLFAKGAHLIQKLFPIVLADSLTLAKHIAKSMRFDTLFLLQAQSVTLSRAYSLLSVSDRPVFVCEPSGQCIAHSNSDEATAVPHAVSTEIKDLAEALAVLNLPKIKLNTIYTETTGDLYSFVNEYCFKNALSCFCGRENHSAEFILHDGRYDRTGTRTNEKEAELAVKTVLSLLGEGTGKTIAVIAFTTAQKRLIMSLLYRKAAESIHLKKALITGALTVKNAHETEGCCFDTVVLSLTVGRDSAGCMSFQFGEASEFVGALQSTPRALYTAVGAAKKHLICLSGVTPEDIILSGNRSHAANALCSLFYFCRDRKLAVKPRAYRNQSAPDYVLESIRSGLAEKGLTAVIGCGIVDFGMDIELVPQGEVKHHAALLLDRESCGGIYEKLLYERALRHSGYRVIRVRSAIFWRRREEILQHIVREYKRNEVQREQT